MLDVAAGFLDADDVGTFVGEGEGGFCGEVDTGAAGHVVDDDGNGRGFGDGAIVGEEAALVGLVVVGSDREEAADAFEVGAGEGVGEAKGVVAAKAEHNGEATADGFDDEFLHGGAFVFGHGGGLAGGAEGDDIVYTRVYDVFDKCFEAGEIDGFLLPAEGGDKGDAGA